MATSVRSLAETILNKTGTVSVLEDVLGVYGRDNVRARSLVEQLGRITGKPFVRVAVVTVRAPGSPLGPSASLQLDLDSANDVYIRDCDAWVYPVASIVVQTNILGANVLINQEDCNWGFFHLVSTDEDRLYNLGRNLGANVVSYYIGGEVGSNAAGCAAHPPDRRGFWLRENAGDGFVFVHELRHVIGDLQHVDDQDNLMFEDAIWTNLPPDLNPGQCNSIHGDRDMEG